MGIRVIEPPLIASRSFESTHRGDGSFRQFTADNLGLNEVLGSQHVSLLIIAALCVIQLSPKCKRNFLSLNMSCVL